MSSVAVVVGATRADAVVDAGSTLFDDTAVSRGGALHALRSTLYVNTAVATEPKTLTRRQPTTKRPQTTCQNRVSYVADVIFFVNVQEQNI